MTNAYYPFNRSGAIDVWGSNDGTVNGATYLPEGGPRGDGAYEFGGDDYIDLPTITSNTDWSVSFWANFHSSASNHYDAIFGLGDHDGNSWEERFFVVSDRVLIVPADGNGNDNSNNLDHTLDEQLNVWDYYTITFDGDDCSLYRNAVHLRTVTHQDFSNCTFNQYSDRRLGSGSFTDGQGSSEGFADGEIDDVRIYDRALSPSEIHELYQYGTLGRDMRHFTSQAVV